MSVKDDKIVAEAKKRFDRVETYESTARARFLEDIKFANGDSDNYWQWPNAVRLQRDIDQRPCLTVNKTRQHNLQIINDARQNKPGITIHPVGNEATFQAAQAFEGVVRHIEYISNAQAAYDNATWNQVEGGIGYWRVITDYVGDDSFDQEIFIRRIEDPLSVYIDPDTQEADASDARWAFVFDDVPRDQFEVKYPGLADKIGQLPLDNSDSWCDEDHIRVAEYYRKIEKADNLLALKDGTTVRESEMPDEIKALLQPGDVVSSRPVTQGAIEWYKIAGTKIVERSVWPGKYIPIVPVPGEVTKIEGQLDRKGHTRALKDPQRMYNYWTSSAVEFVALQTKAPFVSPVAAIEGLETYWETANTANHSVLPYNHKDDQGGEVPAPARAAPPVMAQAYMNGMQVAQQELMMASGQYQAEMGAPSNERSGVAIQQRQRQGDTATYHFIDRQAQAIRYTGRILIDLIPKIYDTARVIKILAEDGTDSSVEVDPQAEQAYIEQMNEQGEVVRRIFNPNVGRYDVEADVGPAYGTRRQEAFNAFMEIMRASPDLMHVAGDLMFRAADFPMADELADRLKRAVPPQLLGQGLSPDAQQAMAHIQQLQQVMGQMAQSIAELTRKVNDKGIDQQREDYRAETDRMKAVGTIDPAALRPVIRELVSQALSTPIGPVMQAHAELDQSMQPPEPEPAAPAAG